MEGQYAIIYVTIDSIEKARELGEHLLTRKLIACLNIVNNVESHYWWKNKIKESKECLMILKTKESLYPSVEKYVLEHHSNTIPEIIMVPIKRGNPDYLYWINKNVEKI